MHVALYYYLSYSHYTFLGLLVEIQLLDNVVVRDVVVVVSDVDLVPMHACARGHFKLLDDPRSSRPSSPDAGGSLSPASPRPLLLTPAHLDILGRRKATPRLPHSRLLTGWPLLALLLSRLRLGLP
jgi:hypothetical protein